MKKTKILFVCLGNICRSPAAEGIMQKLIEDKNLGNHIKVDSSGLIAYHEGEPADLRMKQYAKKRGYNLTSLARKFKPEKDFVDFDLIVTMDEDIHREIQELDHRYKNSGRIVRMTDFCSSVEADEVPDPYYGGSKSFELVLDILEDACSGLLNSLQK